MRAPERAALARARREHWVFEGKTIQLYRWGKGSRRALLAHGWAGHGGQWGGLAEHLAAEGYSVLAFDGPAHGRSEGRHTNLFDFARTIGALLEREGGADLLVAHSFGSAASVLALSRLPAGTVDRLVLITSPDRLSDIIGAFTRHIGIDASGRERIFSYIARRFSRPVSDMQVSLLGPTIPAASVLLLHDPADRILPFANAERIAAHWPQARLVPLPGRGHYRILWDTETYRIVAGFGGGRKAPMEQEADGAPGEVYFKRLVFGR